MSLREIPVPGWSGDTAIQNGDLGDTAGAFTPKGPHMGAWFESNPNIPASPLQALMEAAPGNEPARSMEEIQNIREAVVDCWQLLDHKDSFILSAKDVERLSYSQLANRLGCSKSQAEREHKAAYQRLAPILKAHPTIQERFPALRPTTWNQAAHDALHWLRVCANTTLPVPFEEAIMRGKRLLSSGWQETGGPLTDLLIELGASAFGSIGLDDDTFERIHALHLDRHTKYGVGNINEFKEYGLLIRMSDKVARIKNTSGDFEDESVADAYDDLVGYGAIAHMLATNTFGLPLEGTK